MVIPIGITIGKSAHDYGDQRMAVEETMKQLNQSIVSYKEKFQAIATRQIQLDSQIQAALNQDSLDIRNSQGQLKLIQDQARQRYQTIQLLGILIIAVVLFLYLLKSFGYLADLNRAVASLWRKKT